MDEDGIIHSGKVMIPKIDFSKIKPHVLRSLPKPGIYPLHGCSPDPDFYNKCIDGGRRTKFECLLPFGKKPAFDTNLGLVAVPEEPIRGFVYKSGSLESTVWQLHAEPFNICINGQHQILCIAVIVQNSFESCCSPLLASEA